MTDGLASFFSDLDRMSGRGVKPGLERIRAAFARLGHPEKNLRIVHVAGTNGKGSVTSLLAQLLAASGHSVGFSLSPHVFDYRERMQYYDARSVTPRMISESELLATHVKLLAALPDSLGMTYFEWSIALAVQFFSDRNLDYVVLETGMGGRWDATNACDSILSGVVTIGFDHMAQLGNSLSAILAEKLLIAKPGSDFLFGPRDSDLVRQARDHCAGTGVRFHHVNNFSPAWDARLVAHPFFARKPSYFRDNFSFALALGRVLSDRGMSIDFESFLSLPDYGFPPARCEKISNAPLICIDGAHNQPALQCLKNFADAEWPEGYDLVFGCLNDRDFMLLAGLIASKKGRNFWARFDGGSRNTPISDYEAVCSLYGGEIAGLDDALRVKLKASRKPVLVCGSLYLCAQFAAFWRGNGV